MPKETDFIQFFTDYDVYREYVFLGGGPRDEEYVTDRINVIHREEMLKDTNESRYDSDIQILYLERDVEFTGKWTIILAIVIS